MRKAKFKRLWLIFLIFFCLFQSKTYASIPNPTDNYYLDELNLLDESTKENINKTNKQLEDKTGSQVVVMTCLLYTSGGSAKAAAKLVESIGGKVVCFEFLIELTSLKGREFLKDYDVISLVEYDH